MEKRVLSILLAAVMIVSLMPATAFADPSPSDVCKIGSTGYATLEAAISAVTNGQTITMLQDVTYGTSLTINNGKTFTIDFDDSSSTHTFKWDVTVGQAYQQDIIIIEGNSNVTVKNMEFLVGGSDEQGNRIFKVNSTGTLILNNMTLNNEDSIKNTPVQNNGGTVVIDGGEITTKQTQHTSISPNALNPVVQNLGGTTTFTGNGTYTVNSSSSTVGVVWLGNIITNNDLSADPDNNCGTVIIENGTFNAGTIITANGKGKVTINNAAHSADITTMLIYHGGIKSNITVNNITSSTNVFAIVYEALDTKINFQNGNVNYKANSFSAGAGASSKPVSIKNGKFKPSDGTTDIHDEIKGFLVHGATITALSGDLDGYTYKVETPRIHGEEDPATIFLAWDGGEGHNSMPTTSGNYFLTSDITLSSTWNVPAGTSAETATTTSLCLNGHVIKLADDENDSVINVPQYATLNLYDCETRSAQDRTHKGYVDVNSLWHLDENSEHQLQAGENAKAITGGCITGGNTEYKGGGVAVFGTLNMHGGNICGNSATDGGGVFVRENSGVFNMSGGTISGNTAKNCGGGVNNCGTFNMQSGVIEYNKDTTGNSAWGGGGVAIYNNGKAALSGGEIRYNSSNTAGGGVLILADNGEQKVTMAGISIINNTAGTSGGGVCVTDGVTNTIVVGSTKITGNVIGGEIVDGILSGGETNNFYLSNGKYIQLGTGDDVPQDGMSAGITTETSPTDGSPVQITTNGACEVKYFFADNSTHYVDSADDHLVLKLIPLSTISFDANGGACASESAITNNEGKLANLPTATRNGYTFNGWYTLASGGENITTSTVFTSDTTIYAQWTEVSAPPAPIYYDDTPTVTVPVTGDENTVKVSAKISGNTATVKKIKDADLEKVTEGESVTIDLSGAGKNINTAKIPTNTIEKISEKSALTIKLPVAAVEFDKTATEEIVDQAKGSNIELVVDDVKEVSLNAVQKESVKKLDTAVIIDAYLESNGKRLCTEENGGFNGGKAKVILPYEIKNNRTAENYSIFYVSEEGRLEKLNAEYDEELEAFVFEIEHLSNYVLAYDDYLMPFVDVPADEYYDAIKWAAKNAVTDGVDPVHFNPTGITNRAQMVTFLWKLAGRPEPTISECPFTDVKEGSYYYDAVLWAYENGVTGGTSETTFEPEKNMSRAEAVTFLWKYEGRPYVDYYMEMTDVNEEAYYAEAVRWALAEKITKGTGETTFSPDGDCLRNQIVTFLYRAFFDRTFVE